MKETIQELYDATTLLQAVLNFTHSIEGLLTPEMDYACRRLMAARMAMRRAGLVVHVDAGLLELIALPAPFDAVNVALPTVVVEEPV